MIEPPFNTGITNAGEQTVSVTPEVAGGMLIILSLPGVLIVSSGVKRRRRYRLLSGASSVDDAVAGEAICVSGQISHHASLRGERPASSYREALSMPKLCERCF